MPARWSLAFSVAAAVALLGAALLRAAGRRGTGNARRRGGLALATGVISGAVLSPEFSLRVGVVVASALVLALFGSVVGDRRGVSGPARLVALAAIAVPTVAAGVRFEPTGVAALDVAVSIAWIVAVTNAMRWTDHTDGLAGAITVTVAGGIFSLAAFGSQQALAILAAALGGACVGFLTYNWRPASVFLREGGSLFLGYLVAALSLEVRTAISLPASLVVPLLLVALPLLEIVLVPLGQLRHAKRISAARRDHLSHRLSAIGLSRRAAVDTLVIGQLVLAGVAVFVGRGVVPAVWGLTLGAAVVAVFGLVAAAKDVYGETAAGFSRRVKLGVLGFVALLMLLMTPAAVAAAQARRTVDHARVLVERALTAARAGDARTAKANFAAAAAAFEDARRRLDTPWVSAGLAVPVIGPNVRAAQDVVRVGVDLARTGEQTSTNVDPDRLRVVNGTVPLDEVRRVTPDLERGAAHLSRAVTRLAGIDDTFLLPPVSKALERVERELTHASREADNGVAAARLAPAILGGNGARRYFLAVQNNAELRATGGFIGNWGILTAENGKVHLDRFERISQLNPGFGDNRRLLAPEDYQRRYRRFDPGRTWQNVNMSPDFPTVARVIADLYHQSTGTQVDGILAVDPEGLGALLQLTGPVSVEGWPEPLTVDNVVRVTLSDAYVRFAGRPDRAEFLGDVAHAVVDRATQGQLGNPARISRTLGRAAHQGHLILAFPKPEEEALARQLGVAGDIRPVRTDSLLVTTQNAAGNKLDYYLRRHLDYTLRLDPDTSGRRAAVEGRLELRLDNATPGSGLPNEVIGPYDERFVAGENRSFVSIYTPLGFTAATVDGQPTPLEANTELHRNVYASFVSTPASSSRTLSLDVTGTVRLDRGGWYTLELVRQPTIAPDDVSLTIKAPPGWRIARQEGLTPSSNAAARGRFTLDHTTTIRVRLEPEAGNVWQRLVYGS